MAFRGRLQHLQPLQRERARLNRLPINPHEPELAGLDVSGSSNLKGVPEISIERHYRR